MRPRSCGPIGRRRAAGRRGGRPRLERRREGRAVEGAERARAASTAATSPRRDGAPGMARRPPRRARWPCPRRSSSREGGVGRELDHLEPERAEEACVGGVLRDRSVEVDRLELPIRQLAALEVGGTPRISATPAVPPAAGLQPSAPCWPPAPRKRKRPTGAYFVFTGSAGRFGSRIGSASIFFNELLDRPLELGVAPGDDRLRVVLDHDVRVDAVALDDPLPVHVVRAAEGHGDAAPSIIGPRPEMPTTPPQLRFPTRGRGRPS